MEYYNGKVSVTYGELVSSHDGEPVIAKGTLNSLLYRNPQLRLSRGGGLDGFVRIDYYGLRECYRQRYEAKYGNPEAELKKMRMKELIKLAIDEKARRYYDEYRYVKRGEEVSLTDKLKEEYTINASVLNRLIALQNQRTRYRKVRVGEPATIDSFAEAYEEMRTAYGHTLPTSIERLRSKINQYRREGYASLISGKVGNRSAMVITEEAGEYIVALKRSVVPVYNDRQIFEKYNAEAESRGWKPLKSIQSLRQYLNDPAVEPRWYDAVHGELAAHQRYSRKNRTEMPTMRDSLWYGDGTKLNLYYREWVDGKGWTAKTMQVYEVIDAYSEVLLGYHISRSEDHNAQYNAYRMAIQTSGCKPYEIVHDNQGGHKKLATQEFFDRITGHVHRTTAPYSGQSKTIESVFGRFQQQILHKDWRFTGQNITAKKASSRANLELIAANIENLYTLEELKEAYAAARREWNESAHHATGVSRMEMYRSSVNPDAKPVTELDMIEMFWLTSDKPSTYTDNGLSITINKRKMRYEVMTTPGNPDHEFLRKNRGRKFYVKYDPWDETSIRLYTMDGDGSLRFARIAEPYIVIHRNIQEQTEGERAFIAANISANRADRQERQVAARVIERRHGVGPEEQGLNRPKMAGVTKAAEMDDAIEREVKRRMRKYTCNFGELSPGRIAKEISNALYNPEDGEPYFDMRRAAGKL